MNLERFIASRLANTKDKSSVSGPIVKIAIGAIAIGLAIMIITLATGTGLQVKVRQKVAGFGGHIQVHSFENSYNYITNPISKNQDFYPVYEGIPEIKHIQVYANKPGVIRTEDNFEGVVLKGVGSDYDWSFLSEIIVEGDVLKLDSSKISNDVLISEKISNDLQLKLGDKFNIFFLENSNKAPKVRRLEVAGIYNSGLNNFDENFIIGDLKQIQRLNKWDSNTIGGFEFILDDFNNIDKVIPEVYHGINFDLNAVSIKETNHYILEWLNLFDLNIIVIILIMLTVAGINMVTALLILILEKTQMIGTLKALGANNWDIRKIFLHHSYYLITRGLIIGNAIGFVIIYAQKIFKIVKLNPDIYYVSAVPINVNFLHILLLNAGTLLLVLIMLLIPSYMVTRISPVKAIKFD